MNRIEYESNKRKKIEAHHLLGRVNSDETINLPKNAHDRITACQNSVSVKLRKDSDIMALSSLIGFFELGVEQLRQLRELKIKALEEKNGQNN